MPILSNRKTRAAALERWKEKRREIYNAEYSDGGYGSPCQQTLALWEARAKYEKEIAPILGMSWGCFFGVMILVIGFPSMVIAGLIKTINAYAF